MPTRGDMRRVVHKHGARGTVAGKTRFPRDWSDQDIEDAIELTIRRPSRDVEPFGDQLRFERVVDGVLVRVHVRTHPQSGEAPTFWSAYPVYRD